jgi:glycosyltransferase involved in cell wall biosynthesis
VVIFSIITVCLNAGKDLSLTIESVLNQGFVDFELIIKDGGSDDGSLDFLPDDKRIRLFMQIL